MSYTVGVLYWDGKITERVFLSQHIAFDTMRSLADIASRYPGTIKNVWVR